MERAEYADLVAVKLREALPHIVENPENPRLLLARIDRPHHDNQRRPFGLRAIGPRQHLCASAALPERHRLDPRGRSWSIESESPASLSRKARRS